MKKLITMLTVAAIALLCFTACSSGVSITGITLNDVNLKKGESVALSVEFIADKADVNTETLNAAIKQLGGVVFTVADETVAKVDGAMLTAVGAGETTVTAASADGALSVTAKVVVEVVVEGIEAEDILMNTADEGKVVEYTLLPEGVKAGNVTFAVADEGVITVKDGNVVLVGTGTTELTITADGVEKTVTVTVLQAPEKLFVADMVLEVGKPGKIEVDTGLDGIEAEVGTDYTYTSMDEEIATVDEDGVVTGVAVGETVILVENEIGQGCEVAVEVTEPVATVRPTGSTGGNGTVAATPVPDTTPSAPVEATPQPAPAPAPVETTPTPAPSPDLPANTGGNGNFNSGEVIPGGGVWAEEGDDLGEPEYGF